MLHSNPCQHFPIFKCTKHIFVPQKPQCKQCHAQRENIWLCLHRQCQQFYCGNNQMEHLAKHFEESKKKKKFHCLFINCITAQIYCIFCRVYIQDKQGDEQNTQEKLLNENNKANNNAYKLRLKILPALNELGNNKINGQLQNSSAHQKISKGSVGIFSNRFNHTIHSAVQFLAQCSYFRDIILAMRIDQSQRLLIELQRCVSMICEAKYRAIKMEILDQLIYLDKPSLLTYQRKDPFDIVLYILNKLHQYLHYFAIADPIQHYDKDQWEISNKKSQLKLICPIYNPIEIKLRMNYFCIKCKRSDFMNSGVNFLKLPLIKKNRVNNQIQKELIEHRYPTPLKTRKKSLMHIIFKQQPISISTHELIIQMLKKPIHKDKKCEICGQQMKKNKIQIQKLPDYLILQISRLSKDGFTMDQTQVTFETQSLDFGAFTINKESQAIYGFEAAICIQKAFLYPVMAKNMHNKQTQIFRNQNISYSQKMNPFILCYKKKSSNQSLQIANYLSNYNKCIIMQSIHENQHAQDLHINQQNNRWLLPEFWRIQINHGFQKQLVYQFVCKHNHIKPLIHYRQRERHIFTYEQFRHICAQYKGRQYNNEICRICLEDTNLLNSRKKQEKESILYYNSLDIKIFCMISIQWINKWSKFLYQRTSPNYSFKGHPFPGPIDNKSLLDGNKCKPFLIKNKDFRVVNIYVWKFLKDLYGGGIEIRYGCHKSQKSILKAQLIEQLKEKAKQIREAVALGQAESPQKKSSTMQQSSIFHQDVNENH